MLGGFVFTILTRYSLVVEQTGEQLEPVDGGGAPGTGATLEIVHGVEPPACPQVSAVATKRPCSSSQACRFSRMFMICSTQ